MKIIPRWMVVVPLLFAGCGMAESDQDERDRTLYVQFTDAHFKEVCLAKYDTNRDGRLSRYEARRVLYLDCPDSEIESLWDIREFENLVTLNCRGNRLTDLDLRKCACLRSVDCSDNRIGVLQIDGLHGLNELNCSKNVLDRLEFERNVSLKYLDAEHNRLRTVDVSGCFHRMEVRFRENPDLTTLYISREQNILHYLDPQTEIVTL